MKKITIENNKGYLLSKKEVDQKLKATFPILAGKIISSLRASLDVMVISYVDESVFKKGDNYIAKFKIVSEDNIIVLKKEFEELIGLRESTKNIKLIGVQNNSYYDFNYNLIDLLFSPHIKKQYFFCIHEADNFNNIVALQTREGWEEDNSLGDKKTLRSELDFFKEDIFKIMKRYNKPITTIKLLDILSIQGTNTTKAMKLLQELERKGAIFQLKYDLWVKTTDKDFDKQLEEFRNSFEENYKESIFEKKGDVQETYDLLTSIFQKTLSLLPLPMINLERFLDCGIQLKVFSQPTSEQLNDFDPEAIIVLYQSPEKDFGNGIEIVPKLVNQLDEKVSVDIVYQELQYFENLYVVAIK